MRALRGTAGLLLALVIAAPACAAHPTAHDRFTVPGAAYGRPIAAGFVGLSIEYPTLEHYAGTDPEHLNPVFEALVRNLAPGGRPYMRIGGDSTDWTWLPISGMAEPPWVRSTITPEWLSVAGALGRDLDAHLVPAINLEANSIRIARAEERALTSAIDPRSLYALEVGNEPELYSHFPWYWDENHSPVHGRRAGYDFRAYERDFSRLVAALPQVPLAGPSTGPAITWRRPIGAFLARQPRVRVVTVHRYALKHCRRNPTVPPTVDLLTSDYGQERVIRTIALPVAAAHAHQVPIRVEELNAVACGGLHGVSDVFGSSLWMLEMLYETAQVGADGVNVHTHEFGEQSLFQTHFDGTRWTATVRPEYYGMLLFTQANPPGSRLLHVDGRPVRERTHVWATRGTDGQIRIVLINEDPTASDAATFVVPGAAGAGTLERLTAPGLHAYRGVRLGGRTFEPRTTTGDLPAPRTTRISPRRDRYRVTVPAGSAALITLR